MEAALAAGAAYADARIMVVRYESMSAKNRAIEELTPLAARRAGERAAAVARASARVSGPPLELAPAPVIEASWANAFYVHPLDDVGIGERADLPGNAPRIAEEAQALLSAPQCPERTTTLILGSEQMALQIHESVGHAIELDRILGWEAAFAGTSWLDPAQPGSLRYGSDLMNITADATLPGALGTFGYDDEGVAAQSIDDKRLNFQFGCEIAWEIKDGALGQMFRNPTYTGIGPRFWASMDMVGGADEWVFWGTANCGKGQPMQVGHTGHPSVPARFTNVHVGVR